MNGSVRYYAAFVTVSRRELREAARAAPEPVGGQQPGTAGWRPARRTAASTDHPVLAPTLEARAYFEAGRELLADMDALEASCSSAAEPSGLLSVTMPHGLA